MADEEEEPRDPYYSDDIESPPTTPSINSSFHRMLSAIAAERSRDHMNTCENDGGFEMITVGDFWTSLFSEYFLEGEVTNEDHRDDMLFYVKKTTMPKSAKVITDVEVFRRESRNKPMLDDRFVDWEETVYLNIILHQLEYTVTCAVCTRTGDREIQILRKFSQKVYPSPSKRRMDSKGTGEEIAYPNIFFSVDNFEEAFTDLVVRDSEMVCVELVASDKHGAFHGVIFLGSIRHEALKKVYETRASLSSRWAQRMSLGWFKGQRRMEFVRMRGPMGKGHAEMAMSRVKGLGPETPDMENFPIDDFDDQPEQYTQRRMSDPSNSLSSLVRGSFRKVMRKSRSETENVDTIGTDDLQEVEGTNLEYELSDSAEYNGFWGKSFGQAWHWFKEKRRANCISLNAYLTYVTLPWYRIIGDVLDVQQQTVLTF